MAIFSVFGQCVLKMLRNKAQSYCITFHLPKLDDPERPLNWVLQNV